MSTPASPFQDHAGPILKAEPAISDEQRANLWDVFNQTKDASELASKLQPLPVPDDLKHKLWSTKQAIAPPAPPAPVDKVTDAINKMVTLPPDVLDKAEQHPQVLKAFTTAATTPEKEPSQPAGDGSAAGKDTKTSDAQKSPLAPRADGQPHFPPIPDGHHRVLSGNGAVYDIPQENIEQARTIDPSLHVLNP